MEYIPELRKKYKEEIVPALMKEFGYKSVMQVPRLEKIVLNQGVGQAVADKKLSVRVDTQLQRKLENIVGSGKVELQRK